MQIKFEFDGVTSTVIKIEGAVKADRQMKRFANTQLARYCEPFVPASAQKMLSAPVAITEDYVQYRGPYGHYQYEGVIYGPNIPIMEDGVLVGFFSPPNKPKVKTDQKLQYSHDVHPQAQSHWDKAAMLRHKDDLESDIGNYIEQRYQNGK